MEDKVKRQINFLGALLHDIGKFYWRAQKVKAGVNHETLGEEFIRSELGKIDCLKPFIGDIISAANRNTSKIKLSDTTSAQEREDSEDKAPRRFLEPITNRVAIDSSKNKSENYWYYLPYSLSDNITANNFPIDSGKLLRDYKLDENEYINIHNDQWEKFLKEVNSLQNTSSIENFTKTFYKILEKYTPKVLSAGYHSHPDISLFDHSRMVAALNVCYENGIHDKECLLIYGDIAGIQGFIYEGINEMTNIAKRLRARSFYISLLTDIISQEILDQLSLFPANLIYNGGGHFVILAPNNDSIIEKLKQLNKSINGKLLSKFFSKLNLSLAYKSCNADEYVLNFTDVYDELMMKLNENKKKKGSYGLDEFLGEPFENKFIEKTFSELSNEEKKLGEVIPKIEYLVYVDECDSTRIDNIFNFRFDEFRKSVYFCKDSIEVEKVLSYFKPETVSIYRLNNTEFLEDFSRDIFNNVAKGFKFLGNYIPIDTNNVPLTFEKLAQIGSDSYPLLGILRMDIDNLGGIFKFGLKEQKENEKRYTPSRIAYLSRELSHFFTGYINSIAEKHKVYIAYSGGDDIFAVGSWIKICEFALDVRETFKRFVCNNDNLSISAGILFTKPNFPISQSSILAGEQEKIAKDTIPSIEKDKISIFDIQLSWEEFKEYLEFGLKISSIIDQSNEESENKKTLPRTFIHSLMNLTNKSFTKNGKINLLEFSKSSSKIIYQFARKKVTNEVVESKNTKNPVNENLFIMAERFLISKNKKDFYRKFQFPASIILYKTRRK